MKRTQFITLSLLIALLLCPARQFGQSGDRATAQQLVQIREYIKRNWQTLKRSNQDLAKAAPDPKMNPAANGRWPVYISSLDNKDAIIAKLKNALSATDFASLDFRTLPAGARS